MQHSQTTKNHKIENWTFANAAAREGAVDLVTEDLGKLGFDSDTRTYWRLMTLDPLWQAVGGTAFGRILALIFPSTGQVIPADTLTLVELPNASADIGSANVDGEAVVAPENGMYQVIGYIPFSGDTGPNVGRRAARLMSGSDLLGETSAQAAPDGGTMLQVIAHVPLVAGAHVELWAFQSSADDLPLLNGVGVVASLSLMRIGDFT